MSDHLPLIEVFSSTQGEGLLVGVRQVFVRLAGCNLECAYCDTPGARELSPATMTSIADALTQIRTAAASAPRHHSVAITGGEPLLYPAAVAALARELRASGMPVYLETNGTLPDAMREVAPTVTWVAMDIKLESATGRPCPVEAHRAFLRSAPAGAVFAKAVVCDATTPAEVRAAAELLAELSPPPVLVHQPLSDAGGTRIAGEHALLLQAAALEVLRDVRVIPQCHKLLGVR